MFILKFIIASISLAYATGTYASPLQVKILTYPVVCKPAPISWSGGQPPYYLSIIKDGNPAAAPLASFGYVGVDTSYTWLVNVPADTVVSAYVTDSAGASNFSFPVPVEANYNSACLPFTYVTPGASSSGSTPRQVERKTFSFLRF